jgi:protein transport protein SEC61 subunit gamma-like protein
MKETIKDNLPKGTISDYFNKSNYIRVVRLAKTPDYDEFSSSSIRVLVAIIIVGFLGFGIFEVMELIPM